MFAFTTASIPVYVTVASLSYSPCRLPYISVVCLLSELDLTRVAFFQGKTYFPEVLSSTFHKVVEPSRYVRGIDLWYKKCLGLCGAQGRTGAQRVSCLGTLGRVDFILSSRSVKCIHPIFWARQHTVPRVYLASTLLDVLPHLDHRQGCLTTSQLKF